MPSEHILVTDDSVAIVSLLANEILPLGGYQVSSAMSGEQGLEILSKGDADLILCDLEMPGMNGLDLLHELKQREIHVPAIMMTAFGSEAVATQALRIGVKDYIVKPFTTDEILASIERALAESRLRARVVKLKATLDDYHQSLVVLRAISRATSAGLEPEQLLSRIILAAVYSCKAQGGYIARLNQQADRMEVHAVANLPNWEGKRIDVGSDPALAEALGQEGIFTRGDQTGDWYHIPLIRQQSAVGIMSIVGKLDRQHQPAEYLLSTLAGFAANVLENVQLRSELAVAMLQGKKLT